MVRRLVQRVQRSKSTGSPAKRLSRTDCLFLLALIVIAVTTFSLWSVCVTSTHFVLFAPVFALLSARYRYPSIRFSLRFPPLFCSPNTVFYYTQIIAQSEWVHPPFPLTPTPFPLPLLRCRALLLPPFQIAGLLDTVHTCLVLRCNMCIS